MRTTLRVILNPEADIFRCQTTQNSGPEVGHDSDFFKKHYNRSFLLYYLKHLSTLTLCLFFVFPFGLYICIKIFLSNFSLIFVGVLKIGLIGIKFNMKVGLIC